VSGFRGRLDVTPVAATLTLCDHQQHGAAGDPAQTRHDDAEEAHDEDLSHVRHPCKAEIGEDRRRAAEQERSDHEPSCAMGGVAQLLKNR